jgi:hypothetical protein
MRNEILIKRLCSILLVAAALRGSPETFAGVIDLLKGEKKNPVVQRVAFVGSAVVKETQGLAERLTCIEQWSPLYSGMELVPGDVIRTAEGTILLRMKESGSFTKVTPHTILRLIPFEKGWDPAILSGREEQNGFAMRGHRGLAQVSP